MTVTYYEVIKLVLMLASVKNKVNNKEGCSTVVVGNKSSLHDCEISETFMIYGYS